MAKAKVIQFFLGKHDTDIDKELQKLVDAGYSKSNALRYLARSGIAKRAKTVTLEDLAKKLDALIAQRDGGK